MMKDLFIAEKPSVAAQFAEALGVTARRSNGYIEDDAHVITWCVGHLVTMSYPEKYDTRLKRWSLETLPFLPKEFKYELIEDVKAQFNIVSGLLNREDVGCIYICTDSGREGEYIYRLVDMMAGVKDKHRKRVWIDSQTQEEILRGIREAKDWSEYDHLSDSAYLRAKEDYLMGINFSRLLTLKYGNTLSAIMKREKTIIRIVKIKLKTGEIELLATNLNEKEFTKEELKELYNKRWTIETGYDKLKNIIQLEEFSGIRKEIIEQDFYAGVFIYNLATTIKFDIEKSNKHKIKNKDKKYRII